MESPDKDLVRDAAHSSPGDIPSRVSPYEQMRHQLPTQGLMRAALQRTHAVILNSPELAEKIFSEHSFKRRLKRKVHRATSLADPSERKLRFVELCALVRAALTWIFAEFSVVYEHEIRLLKLQFQQEIKFDCSIDRYKTDPSTAINRMVTAQMELLLSREPPMPEYPEHLLALAAVFELALDLPFQ